MNKDEILKEYKEELDAKADNYEGILYEWGNDFFYEKHIEVRGNLHATAMECINKILPPELKIFLKNLCSNKLGYPDELIFYKAFGDNPEIGQSVTKAELEQKGIDVTEFEKMRKWWGWEGNCVDKQTVDGIDVYYLDSLCERADVTTEEEKERLNASVELKYAIFNKTKMSPEEQDKYIGFVDDLLLGVTPEQAAQRKSIRALKDKAKLLLDLVEKGKLSLPDGDLGWWKNLANS